MSDVYSDACLIVNDLQHTTGETEGNELHTVVVPVVPGTAHTSVPVAMISVKTYLQLTVIDLVMRVAGVMGSKSTRSCASPLYCSWPQIDPSYTIAGSTCTYSSDHETIQWYHPASQIRRLWVVLANGRMRRTCTLASHPFVGREYHIVY